MSFMDKSKPIVRLGSTRLLAVLLGATGVCSVNAGVTFTDVAEGDNSGITYRSNETPNDLIWDELKSHPIFYMEDGLMMPGKSRGNPGIAIFDYDGDGDQDIFVSNSSLEGANHLYSNQLKETGSATYVEVAAEAGIQGIGSGGTGVCFGDIDNDGDYDLYLLGVPSNIMFMNNGDGTFTDISETSKTGARDHYPSSCSFGDINGDGLIDLAVGNSYDNWSNRLALRLPEFAHLSQHNQLFLNKGGNEFEDVSDTSGIRGDEAFITWGVALLDYDFDGDLDLISADDQGTKRPASLGGRDYGYIRIYKNDGTGKFSDMTNMLGTNQFGAWMGLSFGDYNSDGNLDIFGSNAGDYLVAMMEGMIGGGDWSSAWFLGQDDGTFVRPGPGAVGSSKFGWGAASVDYDNDGDTDIFYAGGLDMGPMVASNSGVALLNDGNANFTNDSASLPSSDYHLRRNVQGSAVGDLNDDGYVDIITASNMNWPVYMPLVPYPPLGGQFDGTATFWPTFTPIDPVNPLAGFTWNGVDPEDGTLSIAMNNAETGNNWVKVSVRGSIGDSGNGRVNRDGIGAIVKFTPEHGKTVITPVLSGASHTSAHSLQLVFGLGDEDEGVLEVLWPGGVKNKLYDVNAGDRVLFPEIPCSYDDESLGHRKYKRCIKKSLRDLNAAGVLSNSEMKKFYMSAMKARKSAYAHDD